VPQFEAPFDPPIISQNIELYLAGINLGFGIPDFENVLGVEHIFSICGSAGCWTNMRTQTKRTRGIEKPDVFI
jgi:hypothetical protein